MNRLILFILLAISFEILSNESIDVVAKEDSREWALGNFIISATNGVSEVLYNLTDESINVRYRNCMGRSNKELEEYHRAILNELVKRYKLSDFKRIIWPSFSKNRDYSIPFEIALLSSKSELYHDYKMNYPNSTLKSLNSHFVDVCNQGNVYKDLKELFMEYNIEITIKSCEKVFTGKISDLQFRDGLIKAGLNDSYRVFFDAGVIVFNITQSQS